MEASVKRHLGRNGCSMSKMWDFSLTRLPRWIAAIFLIMHIASLTVPFRNAVHTQRGHKLCFFKYKHTTLNKTFDTSTES